MANEVCCDKYHTRRERWPSLHADLSLQSYPHFHFACIDTAEGAVEEEMGSTRGISDNLQDAGESGSKLSKQGRSVPFHRHGRAENLIHSF